MSGLSLAGQRVVVIGGASGIGHAIATLAQALGASVAIASSNAARVEAAVVRLPGVAGATVDLREEASVATFFATLGAFDHLAITAGDWRGSLFGATATLDLADARNGVEVRLWGALAAAKHANQVISKAGSITLTSGMLAHRPQPGGVLAATIGGAVEHMARGLAIDLAPVRVNAVCPGLILTEHVQQMPQEQRQRYVAGLPVPRAASPEEAAQAYIYAMLNRYVTGQILPVDGGGGLI